MHRDDTAGGLLSIQAEVTGNRPGKEGTQRGLFDDIIGAGGVLLLSDRSLHERLTAQDTLLLADLGWKTISLAAQPGDGQVVDTGNVYAAWLAELHAVAVLIRPDLYLYGAARDADDLHQLLDHQRSAPRTSARTARDTTQQRRTTAMEDTMTDDTPNVASAGWTRPGLPPEGEAGFLDDHPFDLIRSPLPDGVLVEQVSIPMSDGIELAGTVFRPANSETVPAIATSTPYGKDDYQQWNNFATPPRATCLGGASEPGPRRNLRSHPVRGAGPRVLGTSGVRDPPRLPPRPRKIGIEPHSRHRNQPALARHHGLARRATVVYRQRWHEWRLGSVRCPVDGRDRPRATAAEGHHSVGGHQRGRPCGGYGGIPESAFPVWIGQVWIGPNVNHNAAGPEPALFDWQYDTSRISVPALVCASFSDQELHTWDTFDAFTRIKSEHKWLFNHRRQKWGAFYGADELALQKRFLDRFLKNDATAMDGVPAVRLEVNEDRHTFKVVTTDTWPVEGTTYKSLYLDSTAGALGHEPPSAEGRTAIAPGPVNDTGNRAVFDHTFTEDTDLVGHMALRLFIEGVDTTDLDLFVGVEKLDTEGNEVYFFSASGGNANGPVTRGWLRASKRTLNQSRSTEYRPVPDLRRTLRSPPAGSPRSTSLSCPLAPPSARARRYGW